MTTILLAEDEARIARFVEKGLRASGFRVISVTTGEDALTLVLAGDIDLLLLDVGLPGIDGFEVLRRTRDSASTVPIIMLTARTGVADTVAGLDGGANDYIAKPFRFDELLARVRSRLREADQGAPNSLAYGDLTLDLHTRRVMVGGQPFDLSAREFALAEVFFRNPERVLSREQLLSRVWGFDFDPGSNVVDVYVRYLRAKIGKDRIETVRGMGYRLR